MEPLPTVKEFIATVTSTTGKRFDVFATDDPGRYLFRPEGGRAFALYKNDLVYCVRTALAGRVSFDMRELGKAPVQPKKRGSRQAKAPKRVQVASDFELSDSGESSF